MGSFQQIAISIVCLGIAFGFGTYVNTHPSGPKSDNEELSQQDVFDANSNDVINDLDFVEKRPAKMGMMRSPLKPRLDLPTTPFGGNSITQPPVLPAPSDLGNRDQDQSPPPPSSSDSYAVDESIVSLFQNNGTPGIAQTSDVPDFAEAADDVAAMQPSYKPPRTVLQKRVPERLDHIANQTSAEPPTDQRAPATPLTTPSVEPKIEAFESTFTAADFEPQLLGDNSEPTKIKSLTQPPNSLVESTPRGKEELANTVSNNSSLSTHLTFSIEELPAIDTRRRIPFKLNTARTEELSDIRTRSKSYSNFKEHVVREDESLQSISTDYFGKPDFYLDIYLANRENLISPVGIKPGTKLKIPTIKQP
jgi:nucleoid-associated protein YgaU